MEDSLTEIIALVDGTPASHFVKGTKKATQLREALELLYNIQATAKTAIRRKLRKGRPIRLKCDGLEGEQIWSMIQIWDAPVVDMAELMAESLANAQDDVHLIESQEGLSEDDDEFDDEKAGFDDMDEEEGDFDGEGFDDEAREDFDEDDEEGMDEDDGQLLNGNEKPIDFDPELDDEHFHVAEMDAFAEKMEEQLQKQWDEEEKQRIKMEKRARGLQDGDDDDDDDMDDEDSYDSAQEEDDEAFVKRALYANGDDLDEDEEDDDDEEADINVKYEGFFDQPANKFGQRKNEPKIDPAKNSKRAKAKAELAIRIAELEAEAINDKPWELKGEAKASARPKDSLLQKEDLDVDYLKRTAPALTPENAAQIEEVILKRYMEGKFDDCEANKQDTGKQSANQGIVLSKEKSKEGLAETYEKDYAEKILEYTPKEKLELDKEKAEIKVLFETFCLKLDALSNLAYTPKPPAHKDDANRPPDVAAVHMEDVVPTTETGAVSQAAPQELEKSAKGLGKSRKEMEPEERRAARRHKKDIHKRRERAAGIIKPVASAAKRVKTTQISKEASGGAGSDIKWTSSAQVFRKMEDAKAKTRNPAN